MLKSWICKECKHSFLPSTDRRRRSDSVLGASLLMLVAWAFAYGGFWSMAVILFIGSLVVYGLAISPRKKYVCPVCSSKRTIPVESPEGAQLFAEQMRRHNITRPLDD